MHHGIHRNAFWTCVHEAGHAVAALNCRGKVWNIVIKLTLLIDGGDIWTPGTCWITNPDGFDPVIHVAGFVAEYLWKKRSPREYLPCFQSVHRYSGDWSNFQANASHPKCPASLPYAVGECSRILSMNWQQVRLLTEHLYHNRGRNIGAVELEQILKMKGST